MNVPSAGGPPSAASSARATLRDSVAAALNGPSVSICYLFFSSLRTRPPLISRLRVVLECTCVRACVLFLFLYTFHTRAPQPHLLFPFPIFFFCPASCLSPWLLISLDCCFPQSCHSARPRHFPLALCSRPIITTFIWCSVFRPWHTRPRLCKHPKHLH